MHMRRYVRVRDPIAEDVEEDLRNIRIYYRNQILDAIEGTTCP